MPPWLRIRFNITLSCMLWVITCDQLIHSCLSLPRFELDDFLHGTYLILLLVLLTRPTYVKATIISFLIPWLYCTSYCWFFLEGYQFLVALSVSSLGLIFFCYYVKKSLLNSRLELLKGLENLRKGNTDEISKISFFDERGKALRNLNKWANSIREHSRRTQYISSEIWDDLKNIGIREERTSKDRWVISIVVTWCEKTSSDLYHSSLLDFMALLCEHLDASINCFCSSYAELIILEDKKDQVNSVLSRLSELDLPDKKNDQYVQLVVRRNFMKTGVVLQSAGYRFRCVDSSFMEDVKFVRRQSNHSSSIYIHQSLQQTAAQVFHLGNPITEYFLVKSIKNQEYHLQKLLSQKVEDRLSAVRTVEAQRNSSGIETLVSLLEDVSPRVRIAAAGALSKFVNSDNENFIGQSFLNCLENEWNQDMRATLVMSLGKLKTKSLIKPLYKLLSDKNDRVRANAVEAIGQSMDRKTVLRYLDRLLEDENNRARANAAMAVWLMGERRGFKVLFEMSLSEDLYVSSSGLYGMGEIFTDQNIKINSKFVSNPVGYYLKEKSLFDDALKVCIEKTMQNDFLVERNAIIALGKFRSKKSVDVLEAKFLVTDDCSIQNLILNTLLNLEEYELVTFLRKQ